MTIEDYLALNARRYPDKTAVVSHEATYTYATLNAMVDSRAKELRLEGHGEQSVLPIRASQTADFLIQYLAIHRAGHVAAPLEKNTPAERFLDISRTLQGAAVPQGTADVLFTTGTTGRSKGVIISHRTIVADAENLVEGQGFCHDLVFVVHGPLNHIGSLSKIYPVIMLGATLYLLDGLKDIDAFFRALNYPAAKAATFFVPANIRMLTQLSADRLAQYAHRLDFIESGGAPLPHADMLQLCRLLPKTRMYNTYASTETGIISTYNFNDGRCLPGCLGKPMRHSRVFITPDGHIACQGDTLMSGYIGEPELTASVLKDDTVYTADMGQIDDDGMLHIGGRADDVINVGGYKVAPTEVEDAAMSLDTVKDCICISVPHPITGHALKLLVVTADDMPLNKQQTARHIAAKLEAYKVPMLYEQVDTIARTYNGKLDRKHYHATH